jgi:hypothetical protein
MERIEAMKTKLIKTPRLTPPVPDRFTDAWLARVSIAPGVNAREVEAVEPCGSGLGGRIRANGGKSLIVDEQKDGKTLRRTLGGWPHLTLANARKALEVHGADLDRNCALRRHQAVRSRTGRFPLRFGRLHRDEIHVPRGDLTVRRFAQDTLSDAWIDRLLLRTVMLDGLKRPVFVICAGGDIGIAPTFADRGSRRRRLRIATTAQHLPPPSKLANASSTSRFGLEIRPSLKKPPSLLSGFSSSVRDITATSQPIRAASRSG